jgi:c-di-GMP-binding flagellar brake protein YcgR
VRHVTRNEDAEGGETYRIGFEFLDLQPEMREELARLSGAHLDSADL